MSSGRYQLDYLSVFDCMLNIGIIISWRLTFLVSLARWQHLVTQLLQRRQQ